MKKILYSALFLATILACNDLLDVKPENAVTYTNFFQTEKDFGQANAELYARLREIYFTYSRQNPHDVIGLRYDSQNAHGVYPDELKSLLPQAFKEQGALSWSIHYAAIFQANLILDNLYRAIDVPDGRLDFYAGHAHFVKGLVYYEIARRWGDAPVPTTTKEIQTLGRTPAAELLDTARANARKAFDLLAPYREQVDHRGIPTYKHYGHKAAAAALLANIHAWRAGRFGITADYEETNRYCSMIINGELGDFRLEDSPEEVCTNKGADGLLSNESVFELVNLAADFNGGFTTGHYHIGIGYHMGDTYSYGAFPFNPLEDQENQNKYFNYYLLNNATVKAIWDADDKRRQAYFYNFDFYNAKWGDNEPAYPYFWRQVVVDPSWNEIVNLLGNRIFWRLADLYLLRAEARCRANIPGADDDLNVVRNRANAAPYPAPGDNQGLQMAIFREREKELFFDGERYYDIVRNDYYRLPGMISEAFEQLSDDDVQGGALYVPVSDDVFANNTKMRRNPFWLSRW